VESANSALKGAFADLGRGFFRVVGLVKTTVLLGFTLVLAGSVLATGRTPEAVPEP